MPHPLNPHHARVKITLMSGSTIVNIEFVYSNQGEALVRQSEAQSLNTVAGVKGWDVLASVAADVTSAASLSGPYVTSSKECGGVEAQPRADYSCCRLTADGRACEEKSPAGPASPAPPPANRAKKILTCFSFSCMTLLLTTYGR